MLTPLITIAALVTVIVYARMYYKRKQAERIQEELDNKERARILESRAWDMLNSGSTTKVRALRTTKSIGNDVDSSSSYFDYARRAK